ncbi:MAG TPA: flavodoxin [Eubacteriaceae bacterium]|nr:flavodoxin [Eubacteriaceae bacterium]
MNTLIAYSSKYGCTEKCVKILSKELKDKVEIMNLMNVEDIDISKYDNVIIGGSIYIGRIQKEVAGFCSKNLDKLKEKRIGLFICGMQEEEMDNQIINNFPKELVDIALAKEYFGGELTFQKMSFFEKLIVKIVAKTSSDKSNILNDNIYKFAQSINNI